MSWQNALRTEIKLTTPSSLETRGGSVSLLNQAQAVASSAVGLPQSGVFVALWRGGERTLERKLGQFDPPKFMGTVVQDLGAKSWLYPITLYFEGINHHTTAENFAEACRKESGSWEIVHPVKGTKMLQLISCREVFNPIDSANISEFETQWIEPARAAAPAKASQSFASEMMSKINDFKDTAGDYITMAKQIRADSYAAIQSYANTVDGIMGFMDSLTRELAATNYLIQDSYNTAKVSFANAMNNFGADDSDNTEVVAAVLDVMLAVTSEDSDYIQNQEALNSVIDSVETLTPTQPSTKNYNVAMAQEVGIISALIAIVQALLNATFKSRSDIIAAMESLTATWNDAIAIIDTIQDVFGDEDIDKQYIAMMGAYTDLMSLFTSGYQFLLQQFFNLKKEIRKTLKRNTSPLVLTVQEYGSLGADDEYYSLFLESNNISGDEIILLPAGKEYIIYAN